MPRLAIAATLMAGLVPLAQAASAKERYVFDVEWGAAWQAKNEVQSPNDASGTRFGLDRITGNGPYSAPRLQLTMALNPRDDLRLLIAPLRVSGSGTLDTDVNFEGPKFLAGAASATYRFDSYRATWRRTLHQSPDWIVKAGVTGKIRDAEITLQQAGTAASRSNTGLVPLLHLYAQRTLSDRSRLVFDADGLASGRGRAFDLSLRYVNDFRPGLSGFVGVRMLDGGADNDSLYNFARFNYLTAGLSFGLL